MSVAGLLTQSCTVRRRTAGTADGYGQTKYTWSNLATGVPCRIDSSDARQVERDRQVWVSTHRAFFAPTQDVAKEDRIIDQDSAEYDVLTVSKIRAGINRVNHLQAELRLVE